MRKGGGKKGREWGRMEKSSRKWRHKARSRATENAGHAAPLPLPLLLARHFLRVPLPPCSAPLPPCPMDTASRSALNQHFTLMNDDQCPGAADVLLLLPLPRPLCCCCCLCPVSCAQRSAACNSNKDSETRTRQECRQGEGAGEGAGTRENSVKQKLGAPH